MITEDTTGLFGRFVLVNPDLPYDPNDRQNEIGIIVLADIARDEFEVSFRDNTYGFYAADALLVMKPMHEINRLLINQEITAKQHALEHLNLARRADIYHREWKILEAAIKHPDIRPLCLDSVNDLPEVRQSYTYER